MTTLSHLFQPLRVGSMQLRNRVMMPPHGRVTGDPFGTEQQAEQFFQYWGSRARDGVAWVDGLNSFVGNTVIVPGFEPTGLGATIRGVFRRPDFRPRAGRYAEVLHAAGAVATAQLIMQAGMPHSPSSVMANHAYNLTPHVMDRDEIKWLVEEYIFSIGEVAAAGLDGAELHANHEDILQLFLSPHTNRRTDEYGGDRTNRVRIITEIVAGARARITTPFTIGVRLNMDELFEGGYDLAEGVEIARALEATGHIDYIHCVMGNNWGAPSYIQPHDYGVAQWSELAGHFKRALKIPVVYTGRVTDPVAADRLIAAGHADVVGMARAMFADAEVMSKARAGRVEDIRPCIGTNDCLHRILVEGLTFGCSVNPRTGHEAEPPLAPVQEKKKVLVVGGGPAGMELAALAAERGHVVSLWEREGALGGQMAVAAKAKENEAYGRFIAWQQRRLTKAGVAVSLSKTATDSDILAAGFDIVCIATGAAPGRPDVPGAHLPFVVEGRDVMTDKAQTGARVAVIAMEDHMQPLTVANFLAAQGKQVQVIYQTPAIAPLVGKYSIGAPLARLSAAGGTVRVMERVTGIEQGRLATRNIYSGAPGEVTNFDTVVLACGGVAESGLYAALKGKVQALHILGDAYAPRRISFATRQAYALAKQL
jgi:2,4-dienoyl-CoA reductase-like NADH-dependent reductase (Old Yellow Enzyme family)/thioredoxin reductase